MDFLFHAVFSVMVGFGMAVVLVEKRNDWPARIARVYITYWLKKVSRRLPKMLECTVCTSFWTTQIASVLIAIADFAVGQSWLHSAVLVAISPLCGFIAIGFTYVVMDFLISLFGISNKK